MKSRVIALLWRPCIHPAGNPNYSLPTLLFYTEGDPSTEKGKL
jgi:hypothetical protein